tara:strand:+ start:70 stop:939 length:870 start_codon:yes stop_codon:yes gene_type:complete
MALGTEAAFLLRYLSKYRSFNKTATFGRQAFAGGSIKNIFKKDKYKNLSIDNGFIENFLIENMGATQVDSYDYSDYEGATKIYDLGVEINENEIYDTIIDLGTSEHVFNISQSFLNAIKLTKIDGMIIHELPSNNFCGHGLYQLSPEFFFALYSKENGFDETEIYVIDYTKINNPYVVLLDKPNQGERLNVYSMSELGLFVKTIKKFNVENVNVFQDSYISDWKQNNFLDINYNNRFKKLEKFPFFKLLLFVYRYFKLIKIKNKIIFLFKSITNNYKKKGKKIYFNDIV